MEDIYEDWSLDEDEDFVDRGGKHNPVVLDAEVVYDLHEQGYNRKEMGEYLNISQSTLRNKIAEIQQNQQILLQYRTLQSLQLTSLQAKILEQVTDEKIAEAPLRDLVFAYKILKDKELIVDGKPSEIKGLVGYLVQLEKEDAACKEPLELDITPEDHQYAEDGEKLPDL
jgi:hypothetical protein